MNGKQHVIFGTATALTLYASLKYAGALPELTMYPGVAMSTAVFGSMLPDIDHPKSTVGQIFPRISEFLNKHGGHRGITHDLFLFLLLAAVHIHFAPIAIWFYIGYLGHLFLDALTEFGVSWIFLYYGRTYGRYQMDIMGFMQGTVHLLPKGMRIKSDSRAAGIVTNLLTITICGLIYYYVGKGNMDLSKITRFMKI